MAVCISAAVFVPARWRDRVLGVLSVNHVDPPAQSIARCVLQAAEQQLDCVMLGCAGGRRLRAVQLGKSCGAFSKSGRDADACVRVFVRVCVWRVLGECR